MVRDIGQQEKEAAGHIGSIFGSREIHVIIIGMLLAFRMDLSLSVNLI